MELQLAEGQRGFWEILLQVTQLKEELGNLQAMSDSTLQDQNRLQEATGYRAQVLSKLTGELDSLKTDRDRLTQDLKDQAMAVDNLLLQLDSVSVELGRMRSAEEGLQEALKQERTRTSLLRSTLDQDQEEVCRLSQENGSYARLADQLSSQIVEMEEEISTLRDHLGGLSTQLNETADLVLDLRRQLNSKTSEVDRLQTKASSEKHHGDLASRLHAKHKDLDLTGHQVLQLQRDLQDSRDQLRMAQQDSELEKRKMMQQLMELEKLVLDLEEVMDPASPHRTQLEEVRSENGALQDRLGLLQQEVTELEDNVDKKRRKVDEMEKEHERSREEEERLHKENSRYREEVLALSGRNLQLSDDNAELSARLQEDQEVVRMLQERLAAVSEEQQEEETTVRRLQDAALQQELLWTQEKQLMDRQLSCYEEELARVSALEAELSAVTLKLQRSSEDKDKLLREADERNNEVETLQRSLLSVESEAELLRSQLHAADREEEGHAQEVTEKVEELEREKEELRQASVTLQEETHKLRVQNQELRHQLAALQVRSLEVQKQNQEQQNLKTKLSELQTERTQAQDQAQLVQVQHLREQEELLQARLEEEQRGRRQLEEQLRLQAQQSSSHISMKQGQCEKVVFSLHQRVEGLEITLKGVQLVLQEKVQQLKDQLKKNTKCSALLKELYEENSQLMKALQVTEQRQKQAEKKNFLLEDRVRALNQLLREIVPAALAS